MRNLMGFTSIKVGLVPMDIDMLRLPGIDDLIGCCTSTVDFPIGWWMLDYSSWVGSYVLLLRHSQEQYMLLCMIKR